MYVADMCSLTCSWSIAISEWDPAINYVTLIILHTCMLPLSLSPSESCWFSQQWLWSSSSQCLPLFHLCGWGRRVEAGGGGVYGSPRRRCLGSAQKLGRPEKVRPTREWQAWVSKEDREMVSTFVTDWWCVRRSQQLVCVHSIVHPASRRIGYRWSRSQHLWPGSPVVYSG